MFCSNCGKQLEDGSAFCIYCGARLDDSDESTSEKLEEQAPQVAYHLEENSGDSHLRADEASQSTLSSVDSDGVSGMAAAHNTPMEKPNDIHSTLNEQSISNQTKKSDRNNKKLFIIIGAIVAAIIVVVVIIALVLNGASGTAQKPSGVKDSLEDYSWDEIEMISNEIAESADELDAIYIARSYNLTGSNGELDGTQTKKLQLTDGTEVEVMIVGFIHDDKADGNGKAGITFMFNKPMANHAMNPGNTNSGGWESSQMRTWLSNEGMELMPSELAEKIANVRKMTNNIGNTQNLSSATLTSDELWLFAPVELFGTIDKFKGKTSYCNDILNQEGSTYKLFRDNDVSQTGKNELLTKYQDNDQASAWWLRSPQPSTTTNFCGVNQVGGFAEAPSADPYSVLIGFCI